MYRAQYSKLQAPDGESDIERDQERRGAQGRVGLI
jgi:hypothetical protein